MNFEPTPLDPSLFGNPVHDPSYSALFREIERIDLLLQSQLNIQKQRFATSKHGMEGMVITDEEIDELVAQPIGMPQWACAQDSIKDSIRQQSPCATPNRVNFVRERFGLTEQEFNLLMLCLLPQFDRRYETIFAYMQDNAQARCLTIDLALNIVCSDVVEKISAIRLLQPAAPLVHHGLIEVKSPPHGTDAMSGMILLPNARTMMFLLGDDVMPKTLSSVCTKFQPRHRFDIGETALKKQLLAFFADEQCLAGRLLTLQGYACEMNVSVILEAAAAAGRQVLDIDLSITMGKTDEKKQVLTDLFREARLYQAAILFRTEVSLAEADPEFHSFLSEQLEVANVPIIELVGQSSSPSQYGRCKRTLISTKPPSEPELARLISGVCKDYAHAPNINWANLARRFNLTGPDTILAVEEAAVAAKTVRGQDTSIDEVDLRRAFSHRAQRDYGHLARRLTPKMVRDDLVVSDTVLEQLGYITAALRNRHAVLENGFEGKLSYGTGISCLFYGPPGTGKTMLAEVIAGELGVDVVRVDLSTVVNKYIGETEKHLSRIFDLAEADSGVLFFDEADALFGKRGEVKDAQDRHANIQVSYLLQRLEHYPGLVVLATNNRSQIDSAFTRRLTFIVEVDAPDAVERRDLWDKVWPEGIDPSLSKLIDTLAEQVPITGANIKNIALLASWLAADADQEVAHEHILKAVECEKIKIGMLNY